MVDVITACGGNTGSLLRAFARTGTRCRSVSDAHGLDGSNPVVIPGVGSFGAVCRRLRQGGFDLVLRELASGGTPLLGICSGMQVLFDRSQESPGEQGLGIVCGEVVKFETAKVPQTGWNRVSPLEPGWPSGHAYFVNSYHVIPRDVGTVLYSSAHEGTDFVAGVCCGQIAGFQFHPEKSHSFGDAVLARWCEDAL